MTTPHPAGPTPGAGSFALRPQLASPGSERTGRERILAHARALFLERGFLDVSMREIAEAAELRKATIYHHFRDKEDLFIAIALEEMTSLRERMTESIAAITALPERLEELAFTQFSSVHSTSMRFVQDFRDFIPESRHEEMHHELELLFAVYRDVFTAALTTGEIAGVEPAFAASSFFNTILAWTWNFPGGLDLETMQPRELATTAVRILLYGVAGPALKGRES